MVQMAWPPHLLLLLFYACSWMPQDSRADSVDAASPARGVSAPVMDEAEVLALVADDALANLHHPPYQTCFSTVWMGVSRIVSAIMDTR